MEQNIIDKENFVLYLKKYYPHLFDFQEEIQKIADKTGFGDFSMTCIVRNGEIFSIDFGGVWVKRLYNNPNTQLQQVQGQNKQYQVDKTLEK